MAFTINQSAVPSSAPQSQQVVQAGSATQQQTAAPVPQNNSPFLFVQYMGQQMPIMAYVQLVLLLVAVLSVFLTVVLFGYSYYLKSSIESNKEKLAQEDASFKTYPIKEMQAFNNKILIMQDLLKGYVSVRSPLKLLESVVEKHTYFNDFSFTRKGASGYTMSFSVNTTNYPNLIQQLDALGLPQYTKVAPGIKDKDNKVSDSKSGNAVKVLVNTPVFVQGVLPDDVVFIDSGISNVSNQNATGTTTNGSVKP